MKYHFFWQHRWILVGAQSQIGFHPTHIGVRNWSVLMFACKCGQYREKWVAGSWAMPVEKSAEVLELERMMKIPEGETHRAQ